ncbi:hypothetical protein NDU88_009779 [Pleurodeles waltl]|uniref:Uncharacterized protein n=1 Tax=Pleurodeles waltl TaxID=8319 RepID=A0AAV7PT29_PLEWA|nr:hypothetical protein NDU88_009779 [Pleurodeles waltl]
MEVHSSPALFPPEENQEEAEVWSKFMAVGQAKGLERARKMVAAQGAEQQSENTVAANTDEVQPSDSGLCLLNGESVVAPAKRKHPTRTTAGNKLKAAKKDIADSNLPEGPSTSQKDSGPSRTKRDILEQEEAGASGVPLMAGVPTTGANMRSEQGQTGQPTNNVFCTPAPGPSGRGCRWVWGADITVPSKEVKKHKWKRKVKPDESIDNWLEAVAMLSTVIMEKFPEQGPALCKYNRVIYEEYTRNGGTG